MDNTSVRLHRRIRVRPLLDRPYRPTVTVVISCYNYAHYLPQAVQSCISQRDVDVDVIIVDDASTDDSLAVAEGLSRAHANVSVVTHSQNKGMVETFNDGAKVATGEFLVRLDADDLLTPGSLSRATLVAQNYPSVGLVYGHPIHFSGVTLPKARERATAWTIWPGTEWLRDRCLSGRNVITSPEVLMRRALLETLGYQSQLRHTPDMELWFRLSAFADVAYVQGADQAWHRDHEASMSAKEVDDLVDLRERHETFEVLFDGVASNVEGVSDLRSTAIHTLATEALLSAQHEMDRGAEGSTLSVSFRELAREIDPLVATRPAWARLIQREEAVGTLPGSRFIPWARRLAGRIRAGLMWWRWHRTGVL